jgi:hypothetical protein
MFQFYTAGTERMRIDSSGNVGIGTASPAGNSLTIEKSSVARLRLAESGVRSWDVEATSGSWRINNATNSIEAMRIDSSGRVGIGTSSPSNTLHVDKDTGSTPTVYINNGGGDSGDGVALKVQASGRGTGIGDASVFSVHNNASEIFTVRNDGKVGIGTTSPTTALTVSTDGTEQLTINRADASINTGNTVGTVLFTGDDPSANQTGARIQVIAAQNWTTNAYGSHITFSNDNSGTITERMRIDSSGNVGIGTTSPSNMLHLSSSDPTIRLQDTDATGYCLINSASNSRIQIKADEGNNDADTTIEFHVDGSERMRIDSSGNLALGAATASTGIDTGITRMRVVAPNSNYGVAATFVADSVGRGMIISNQSGSQYLYFGTDTMGAASNNALKFITYGSERARIDSSGHLLVGTTVLTDVSSSGTGNEGAYIKSDGSVGLATSNGTVAIFNRKSSHGVMLDFRKDGTTVGSISTNGNSLPSDRNFKKNIEDLRLGLNFVSSLNPVTYNYKMDDDDSPIMTGLIAQDVETALEAAGVEPNSMTLLQHKPIEDEKESDYQMDYLKLVPVLINAVKELSAQVDELKAEVAALKGA